MRPLSIMMIAGEASGDLLAAELVPALREELIRTAPPPAHDCQPVHAHLAPRFFGAGGPRMAAAGVDLAFDLTRHSVIGLSDVLKEIPRLRARFLELFSLALRHKPDAILCVDYGGFNSRFAHAIRNYTRSRRDWFHNWQPVIVQYVSPQVWASRERRAYRIARDYDLVLSIFPFEKDWYARRVPQLPVTFVGHPLFDRYPLPASPAANPSAASSPLVLLLPGSRTRELSRHLPPMLDAWGLLRAALPALRARMILPNETLRQQATALGLPGSVQVQIGGLPESLREAALGISKTGTVTMECAFFGVPTVTLYKTSWSTYQVAKRIVKVKSLTMPNLLADEPVFPEFVQNAATGANLARAGLELLRDPSRRQHVIARLASVIASLGGPGASRRAAAAVAQRLSALRLPESGG